MNRIPITLYQHDLGEHSVAVSPTGRAKDSKWIARHLLDLPEMYGVRKFGQQPDSCVPFGTFMVEQWLVPTLTATVGSTK